MPKTISVSITHFNKLKKIKDFLSNELDVPIHWNETIGYILEMYEKALELIIKNEKLSKNIEVPAPKLPKMTPIKRGQKKISTKKKMLSDIELDQSIPPPPKKKPIKIRMDPSKLEKLTKKETAETKFILIECQICGNTPINMPVPKHLVLDAVDPVVDISYIHGNPEHVIVAQLDHDFQVRRRRASWIVYEKDYSSKE